MSPSDADDAVPPRHASIVEALSQDIRFAVRMFRRDRAFTFTAVAVLGLGIGVNNMLFTMVHAHTLRGLPIRDASRVLDVSTRDEQGRARGFSAADYEEIRRAAPRTEIAAFVNATFTVGDEGRAADRLAGGYVSTGAFPIIGIEPALGRVFIPADERDPARPVVLGARAFRVRYQSDPGILGRTILVNDTPATVIGVLPEPSGFPSTAEVWLPLWDMPGLTDRGTRTLRVIGRVNDAVSVAEARSEIEAAAARLEIFTGPAGRGLRPRVVAINETVLGRLSDPAWMAFTAVSFLVLVVSCANVANLLLARAIDRGREIAIRASLGATRPRIAGQLLMESLVLAGLGGAVGLVVSLAGIRVVRSVIPVDALPYWMSYRMDAPVFASLVAVSFAAVLLFGLVPAFHGSRADVNAVIKAGGRGGSVRTTQWVTSGFLAAQLGLTVILLSYVVLDQLRSTPALPSDSVVAASSVLTASITLPPERYGSAESRGSFYQRLEERIAALPGIAPVSLASALPLGGAVERPLDLDLRPRGADDAPLTVLTVAIDGDYFDTLGLPLLRGRSFSRVDGGPASAVAIVNERFVERFLAPGDPIGRRIRLGSPASGAFEADWLTVVGVAPSIRQRDESVPDPIVYLPVRELAPATVFVLVRSPRDRAALTLELREQVRQLDASLPLDRVRTLTTAVDEARWVGRMSAGLIRFITGVALGLALVGLYGVTAHAVARRAREIALRVAVGARPGQVARLILRRAAGQVAAGLALGIAGATAWDAAFFSGRADARFVSPDVLAPVAVLLTVFTAIACLVPIRRASRVDPAEVLRQE